MNRLSADTSIIGGALTESVSMAIRGAGTLTLGTGACVALPRPRPASHDTPQCATARCSSGFLFYTSWELALVSTACLLPMLGISRVFGRYGLASVLLPLISY